MRFAAVAAKTESTSGTDAFGGTPGATDWIAGDCVVAFNPDVIQNAELTGSLDQAPSIIGGLKPSIRITVPLRGSGTAGTAPVWGRLLTACTFKETVTAAAIGAPTAAASGTTTSVTCGTPFAATAQLYRGMPLVLTGDQSTIGPIVDYTAAKVAMLGETLALAATASTLCQIPINVLYSPTSDESVYKTVTLYFYADGLLWTFVGGQGTWSLDLTTGGIGMLTFEFQAQFGAHSATAMPTGWNTTVLPTPPRFVGGKLQLNKTKAQANKLTVQAGVKLMLPDDPEASEGYGPAEPESRDSGGSIDPLMNTTTSVALFNAFRSSTPMSLTGVIGSTAGNRFCVTGPASKATGFTPGTRDGLGQNAITFALDGADAAVFLAQF
jgi:hypothetical protein